jgi:general secretion pathway protein D
VEAAIIETAQSLNEVFAAGLGAADADDGAVISNFGTTPTGLGADGEFDPVGALGSLSPGGSVAVFSGGDLPIPVFLQWLEGNTDTRVLSRPSLLTNDNQEAELAAETETAYQVTTTGQNSVTTSSFETVTAGVRLGVSPTISAGNYLRLRVQLSISDFQPSQSGIAGAPPDITSREIETPVTVPDGHTVILGGLVTQTSRSVESKWPWLGDLPLLGWLFRSSSDTKEDRYLYVFITSHIIDTDFALLDEISAARKQDLERLGGDVRDPSSSLSAELDTDTVLSTGLSDVQEVFEMPTVSVPSTGDREVASQMFDDAAPDDSDG